MFQSALATMDASNEVFNIANSSQAAAEAASGLKDGTVFEGKDSLRHVFKVHLALNGYSYRMQLSNATTIRAICYKCHDAEEGEEKSVFCLYAKRVQKWGV